jgi:hypothetical protein
MPNNLKVIIPVFIILSGLLLSGCSHSGKVHKKRDGILVPIGKTLLKLQVCESNIIRVVHSPSNVLSKRKSLVVETKWKSVHWTLTEDSNSVTVETDQVAARVYPADGRITFLDKNRNVLLTGAGLDLSTFQSAIIQGEEVRHVRQAFGISKDEGLYGLGSSRRGS